MARAWAIKELATGSMGSWNYRSPLGGTDVEPLVRVHSAVGWSR